MTQTKPLSFWAVRQKSTGWWLPGPNSWGAGHNQPFENARPRIFNQRRHAESALKHWQDAGNEFTMEIVELRLTEVITRVALINPEDFFASLPGDSQ